MSKEVIDEKIVEMRFDNQQFEKNVSTSISTLDKLKKSLNFNGAEKSFNKISDGAKKVNLSGLQSGIETVSSKFSAMEVAGITALANLTNSAVNAGKKLAKSLTTDQISAGWNKYNEKIGNVQTIMNATGESMEQVEQHLDKLMWFSDETSFSFNEMTGALADMVNAGTDAKKAIPMIWGIAEATAYVGKSGAEFQHVIRNIVQSYSSGALSALDWKSVALMKVNSDKLVETLIEAGEALGTLKKGSVDIGSFEGSLKDKWATRDVMELGFGKWAAMMEDAYQLVNEGKFDNAAEAIDSLSGKYEGYVENATKAAQQAKSFKEAIEATKDVVSSGWLKTFEIIFGKFEQARDLWSAVTEVLYNVVTPFINFRNSILDLVFNEKILGSGEDSLASYFTSILAPVKEVKEEIASVVNSLEDYQNMAMRVIRGDFGNQGDNGDRNYRKKGVEAAGYEYAKVQNIVNELLGCTVRLQESSAETASELAKETTKLTKKDAKYIQTLSKMSDKELAKLGIDSEQIDAIRTLSTVADDLGLSVKDLVLNMDNIDGRWIILDSFKNIGKAISSIVTPIKEAWEAVYPPEYFSEKIQQLIINFHKFTSTLKVSKKKTEGIRNVFTGLLVLIQSVSDAVGKNLGAAFRLVVSVLKLFKPEIKDFSGNISEAMLKMAAWIDEHGDLSEKIDNLLPKIKEIIDLVKDWIDVLKECIKNKDFSAILDPIGSNVEAFAEKIKQKASIIGVFLLAGLYEGVTAKAKSVWDNIKAFALKIIEIVTSIFGIHSPSKVFYAIGAFIMLGLLLGLSKYSEKVKSFLVSFSEGAVEAFTKAGEGFKSFLNNVKDFGNKVIASISQIDFAKVFAMVVDGAIVGGLMATSIKLAQAFENLTAPLVAVQSFMASWALSIAKIAKSVSGYIRSLSGINRSAQIINIAIALAILAGSLFLISKIPPDDLTRAGIALVSLAGGILVLTFLISLMGKMEKVNLVNIAISLAAMAGLLLSVAFVLKILNGVDESSIYKLGEIMIMLIAFIGMSFMITQLLKSEKTFYRSIALIGVLTGVMLAMAIFTKIIDSISPEGIAKGAIILAEFDKLMYELVILTHFASSRDIAESGMLILAMAASMIIMSIAIKILDKVSWEGILKGEVGLFGMLAIIAGLVAISRLATTKDISKSAGVIVAAGVAILAMALAAKILATMNYKDLAKATLFVAAMGGIVSFMIWTIGKSGSDKKLNGVAITLIGAATAIAIMAGIAAMLGFLPIKVLAKGIVAVAILGLVMAAMIKATENAAKCKENLIVMVVAIGIMAAAVAALAFIAINYGMGPLLTAAGCIAVLMLCFAAMEKFSFYAHNIKIGSIVLLIVAVTAMAGIVVGLSRLAVGNALPNAIAVGVLLMAVGGFLKIMDLITKEVKMKDVWNSIKLLIPAIVAIGALAFILSLMKDVQNPIQNAVALSILLLACAGIVAVLSLLGDKIADNELAIFAGVVALAGVILVAREAVWVLNSMKDLSTATRNVIAVSLFMLAMTGLTAILIAVGGAVEATAGAIVAGAVALGIVILACLGAVYVLNQMNGVENAIENGMALAAFMAAMTVLLIPLIAVGGLAVLAFPSIIALTALALPMLVFIKLMDKMSQVDNAIMIAMTLATFMGKMADVLVKVSLVGPLAMIGVPMLTVLISFMTGIGLVFDAIGAILTKTGHVEQAEKNITAVIDLLSLVSSGLGKIAGSFIAGFAEGLTSTLPSIVESILSFNKLNDKTKEGVKCFTEAILLLTASNIIEKFGTFGGGFLKLAADLGLFAIGLTPFFLMTKNLTPDSMLGVKYLAESINALSTANIKNSIANLIPGSADFSKFGFAIATIGAGIGLFALCTEGINLANVETAAAAGKEIIGMVNEISKSGGLVGKLTGNIDMKSFGENLEGLGDGIKKFAKKTSSKKVNYKDIEAAAGAGTKIAEMTQSIAATGGIQQMFTGEKNIKGFATGIENLGTAINTFHTQTDGITGKDIKGACKAGVKLCEMCDEIPLTGGIASWFKGKIDVSGFAESTKSLATAVVNFANGIKEGKINADQTKTAAKAGLLIAQAASEFPNSIPDIEAVSTAISELSTQIAIFYTNAGGITEEHTSKLTSIKDSLNEFISGLNATEVSKVSTAINMLANTLLNGIKEVGEGSADGFVSSIETLATSKLTEAIKTLGDANDEFVAAGKKVVDAIKSGVSSEEKQTELNNACVTLVTAAAKVIPTAKDSEGHDIKYAGKMFVQGLADGINNNAKIAKDAAYNLGAAVVESELSGQKSASPSKATFKAGKYFVQGWINGVNALSKSAYSSAENLGSDAVSNLSNTLSNLGNMVGSDIDYNPTIRPVMDISNVKTGVGAINDMLNFDSKSSVMLRTNGISSGIASNRANANNDITSAIKGLANNLPEGTVNNYNVNGVTYDDGSNIADAVQMLIRAAKVERRV